MVKEEEEEEQSGSDSGGNDDYETATEGDTPKMGPSSQADKTGG